MKAKHLQNAVDSELPSSGPGFEPRTLLLAGAGHAHVHVLATLAQRPLVGVNVVLVAPHPRQMYSGMVPGMVAGHYTEAQCAIALPELVRRAGVRWLQTSLQALDANTRRARLDDGSTLAFEWASLNTGPVQNRERIEAAMPGARTHALFLRPIEGFAALWPKVLAMAQDKALRLAVIGGCAGGVELALALHHRLPQCAITLVCGERGPGADYPAAVCQRIEAALRGRRIAVLREKARGFTDSEVLLGQSARLACDVPLIAVGAHAPAWLQGSGLALDEQGFVQVNAMQQSISHPYVLAVGDVSTRTDRALPRSGVYAVRAGPALARNLAALCQGQALLEHQPPQNTLNLISCGNKTAIASWGRWSAQGRWVWWWKDAIDRRFMARYGHSSP